MDALSPNTSAFISYLASAMNEDGSCARGARNPTSLPPSAFFPVPIPGRDTPEDTPPSSNEHSLSPEKRADMSHSLSDDSDDNSRPAVRRDGQGIHKRKAGGNARLDDEDEDDDESGSASGHEGKRQHGQNEKKGQGGGRKGRRKSGSNEDVLGNSRDVGKAARRKEQNRAAQKAFRERREAKVRDLEEKVAELEAKSYGATVENENLRGILRRLQEENVALKQSAFTFSMPVSGSGTTPNPATPNQQSARPPSPPHNVSDERLRSIKDLPAPVQHLSSGTGESPESLVPVSSKSGNSSDNNGQTKILDVDAFNAFALGGRMARTGGFPSNTSNKDGLTSSSSNINTVSSADSAIAGNQSDMDALFATFYPDGVDAVVTNAQKQDKNKGLQSQNQQLASNSNSLYTHSTTQSFAQSNSPSDKAAFNTMAYRDPTPARAASSGPTATIPPSQDAWTDFTDNSVNDFLASLTGANNDINEPSAGEDDFFNTQLQHIFQQSGSGNSPSAAFALPQKGPSFSPNNYLNMSPSLNSVSHMPSPASQQTTSNSASPESSADPSRSLRSDRCGAGVATLGPPKAPGELVYVVDDKGKVIKPSELWVKMGMQHEDHVDHLLIDDLCDQMRAKATCRDGTHYLSARDAEYMLLVRSIGRAQESNVQ